MPSVTKQTMRSMRSKPKKVSENIADGIMLAKDIPRTGIKFLVYGPSGTGKTTLACTFPKPLLLIRPEQVEDGSLSVRTVAGVEVTPFLTVPEQLDELVEYQQEKGRYKTLVLDGVTKFQDLNVKKVGGLREIPAQLSWGILTQQDWGIVSNEFKEHIRKFLRLAFTGCNLVITGGERALNVDGENDNRILAPSVMVALTPSSMGWLHEVCDYNVRSFIRRKVEIKTTVVNKKATTREVRTNEYEYCIRSGPDDIYQTKFRVPKGTKLPDVIVDPSFDKVNRLVQGG